MATPTTVRDLRCEYWTTPLGIDVREPRLAWLVCDERRGAMQSAYRILAASTPAKLKEGSADLWDSGRVESDASVHVPYAGKALNSGQRAYWTVRTWTTAADGKEQAGDYAEPAWWETGLLEKGDWKAEWIGSTLAGGRHTTVPAPFVRKEFSINKSVASARLYATALGLYEARLNGNRVGEDYFTPGWTEYRKRVQYRAYDVTGLLKQGSNAIGAILGDGWYCGYVGMDPRQMYGDRPKFLAQLQINYEDGSTQTLVTDGSWKWSAGPILESDIMMGESYDARREMAGWDLSGFDERKWLPVETFADPGIARSATMGGTVRKFEQIRPIKVTQCRKSWDRNAWIVDLGQNMVGWVRLKVKGEAGRTITLRYAEMLDKDGKCYTTNLRGARATDHYTLRGDPAGETWEPRFTFHGFRYVEVDRYPGEELPEDAITGIVLHSDMERTGSFECSDPLVNQLQHNIIWGQKGNYFEVPTDCPQRDERLGWTGDAQVFIRTGAFNHNVAPFFTKWQQDLQDAQGDNGGIPPVIPNPSGPGGDGGPAWADAVMICPWTVYLCYGDSRLLQKHYDSLRKFVNFLDTVSRDYVRSYEGIGWSGFGDWLALDGGEGVSGRTPHQLIGTAFYAYSTELLVKIAKVLGKEKDAAEYAKLHEKVRNTFIDRFVTNQGLVYADTQTAYVLALQFNLLPEQLRSKAAEALERHIKKRGNKLATGFVGTPYLNHVLTSESKLDTAYALLFQKKWPSWLYAVTQGATTIWERWDGWTHDKGFADPGMNSFNHYAYGAIGDWLYRVVAGIELDPDRPAYKHTIIRPRPGGGLTHARASLKTVHGPVESAWRLDNGRIHLDVTIPPNASATVYVPTSDPASVTESGKPAANAEATQFLRPEDGAAVFKLGAGRYSFAAEHK